jgi:hypothetical protein
MALMKVITIKAGHMEISEGLCRWCGGFAEGAGFAGGAAPQGVQHLE